MTPTVENIWKDFANKLRAFIRSRIHDHATSDDILQDVFVKIHKKLPALRASERLEAWVWRITRNVIADYFRRKRNDEPLPAEIAIPSENEPEVPDHNRCVRRFVEQLSPDYRDALLLTEWQGLTQEAMAQNLGLSHSGAKSRVQRARGQLKKLFLDCCRLEIDRRGNVLEMLPRRNRCEASC